MILLTPWVNCAVYQADFSQPQIPNKLRQHGVFCSAFNTPQVADKLKKKHPSSKG